MIYMTLLFGGPLTSTFVPLALRLCHPLTSSKVEILYRTFIRCVCMFHGAKGFTDQPPEKAILGEGHLIYDSSAPPSKPVSSTGSDGRTRPAWF